MHLSGPCSASNDTILVRETTYHYDPLGRLRSVDQNGLANARGGTALTLHTATDYFDPNTPDAEGWNVVQYQPYEQETNAKALATKIRGQRKGTRAAKGDAAQFAPLIAGQPRWPKTFGALCLRISSKSGSIFDRHFQTGREKARRP